MGDEQTVRGLGFFGSSLGLITGGTGFAFCGIGGGLVPVVFLDPKMDSMKDANVRGFDERGFELGAMTGRTEGTIGVVFGAITGR